MKLRRTRAKLKRREKTIGGLGGGIAAAQLPRLDAGSMMGIDAATLDTIGIVKYQDVGPRRNVQGSRLSSFYREVPVLKWFEKLRRGPKLPDHFTFYDHEYLVEEFKLKGWQFGGWLSHEDRFNYTCAAGIALYDLNRILGFGKERLSLFGHVGIALGARGKGRALAHYEPSTGFINLTRYPDADDVGPVGKINMQLILGGVGALAHEYGHALDYWGGTYLSKSNRTVPISGGLSLRVTPDEKLLKRDDLRGDMERVMMALIWQDAEHTKHTKYYAGVLKRLKDDDKKGDYWKQHNELWARAFEQWISWKLSKSRAGGKTNMNKLLARQKYGSWAYMKPGEFEQVAPLIEALVKRYRSIIKEVEV